ncbi:MAG: ABC transporter substrate-binding protein [Eubacterium coprostanoligenes]|uniref:ABC transporter substrate-binding protein n=1 Tax=Eubacterium coprostanoligenes TaxID=290054 RepID=UPI00240A6FAF|nr:ABC transporter substrate-binding protein [Eubacterium coprostanoligenes]MDD6665066.1 ABC transporter substrate-binding protein [Eubacterium coprostanoligenes]
MKKFKKIIALLLALSLVCAFAACSKTNSDDASDDTTKELKDVTLCLDWTPNTNHTGFYVALQKGYYKDAGLNVSIVQPPENGATEACSAGQAQFAIDAQDTIASAFTSATPMQVTAVAALLQHNTSCVMSKKGAGIDRPKGLEGKTYLTWDSPIELAMLENVVKADGGDWSKVKRIPNTVTDEAQDVKQNPDHAIWVFDGWGGVNAQVNNVEVDRFFFKDLNPTFDYYTPILIANNDLIKNDPETVKAFLSATKKGYEYAIENPDEAAQILIDGDDTGSLKGSEELVKASQKYMVDQYIADAPKWGYIDPARWNAFYNWLGEEKIVEEKIPENTGFTNDYLA